MSNVPVQIPIVDFRHDRYAINANWLMKLRWVAVIGQLSTIFVVAFVLDISVPWTPLLVAIAVTTTTNAAFTKWLRQIQREDVLISAGVWNRVFMSLMVLDLVVLTLLLFFTGGHTNPFILFFFVNLALAGILLPPNQAWMLNVLSVLCFLGLLFSKHALPVLEVTERLSSISEIGGSTLAHRALFAAFATCSSVIVYFVTRLNLELRRGDEARTRAGLLEARSDKWEALGTLSAGAAHELASPLATIAIVTKELEHTLTKGSPTNADLQEMEVDVQTVRAAIKRCRTILDRMSIDAGHATSERLELVSAANLVESALAEIPAARQRIRVQVAEKAKQHCLEVPPHSVKQALRAIIQNSLDASDQPVTVTVDCQNSQLSIEIRDLGPGMDEETLRRADEPFFTTKEAGKGMGLGRFIARTVFQRIGGTFTTESSVDQGTAVTVTIPKCCCSKFDQHGTQHSSVAAS